MHPLLDRYLERLGIKDVVGLKDDEKETFDRWSGILSKDALTLEDIGMFCDGQISRIEARWSDLDSPADRNERLICQHAVYRDILEAIGAPKRERERLEKHLEGLIGAKG